MNHDQLKALYTSWWKASFGTTPNNQAAAVAASWAEHLLESVNPPDGSAPRQPLWQVMRDIDHAFVDVGVNELPYAAMLEAIAERVEVEPSIVKFSGVAAFLRAEARRYERDEA